VKTKNKKDTHTKEKEIEWTERDKKPIKRSEAH
jgi:hypothetical protein